MAIIKVVQLEYLRKEKERLENAIDRYLSIGLDDMVLIASEHLRAVEKKIEEMEELEN